MSSRQLFLLFMLVISKPPQSFPPLSPPSPSPSACPTSSLSPSNLFSSKPLALSLFCSLFNISCSCLWALCLARMALIKPHTAGVTFLELNSCLTILVLHPSSFPHLSRIFLLSSVQALQLSMTWCVFIQAHNEPHQDRLDYVFPMR